MGLEPFLKVPVTEVTLAPGDRLLLYTDGVSELFNEAGEPYGEKRCCAESKRPTPMTLN